MWCMYSPHHRIRNLTKQCWWWLCARLHLCTTRFSCICTCSSRLQAAQSEFLLRFYASVLLCLVTGTSPAKPSLGTAADRAAAHQFARSLSQKGSLSGLPDRQAMPSMPQTPFAQASARGSPETPQQVVPPSMRVRSLSRQFSERAQQLQTTR